MGAERRGVKSRTIRARVLMQGVVGGLCKMAKAGAVAAVAVVVGSAVAAGLVGVAAAAAAAGLMGVVVARMVAGVVAGVVAGAGGDITAAGTLGMEADGSMLGEVAAVVVVEVETCLASSAAAPKLAPEVAGSSAQSIPDSTAMTIRTTNGTISTNATIGWPTKNI
jgi:hypothetical protein